MEIEANIPYLPTEDLMNLMCALSYQDMVSYARTNRRAKDIFFDPYFRRNCVLPIFLSNLGNTTVFVDENSNGLYSTIKGITDDGIVYRAELKLGHSGNYLNQYMQEVQRLEEEEELSRKEAISSLQSTTPIPTVVGSVRIVDAVQGPNGRLIPKIVFDEEMPNARQVQVMEQALIAIVELWNDTFYNFISFFPRIKYQIDVLVFPVALDDSRGNFPAYVRIDGQSLSELVRRYRTQMTPFSISRVVDQRKENIKQIMHMYLNLNQVENE